MRLRMGLDTGCPRQKTEGWFLAVVTITPSAQLFEKASNIPATVDMIPEHEAVRTLRDKWRQLTENKNHESAEFKFTGVLHHPRHND